MRETFMSWYPPTDQERRRAYQDGVVVLDTNVLLSLYRFTSDARTELLRLLKKVSERLWLPHQVGLEFHRNRLSVIHDAAGEQERLRKELTDAQNRLRNAFQTAEKRIGLKGAPLAEALTKAFNLLDQEIAALTSRSDLTLSEAINNDPILDALTALYHHRVGKPYEPERYERECKVALQRIKDQIPPGYRDAKKDDPTGEYLIWRQTLDQAAERKQGVLFVTQDRKPDWYRQEHGLNVGPRPELIEEMHREAGVRLHLVFAKYIPEPGPNLPWR